jgi:hypothetical protein
MLSAASRATTAAIAVALVVACGEVPSGGSASGSPPATVVARDADNGKTLHLRVGDRLEVRLNSTYWTFADSSRSPVVRQTAPATISPQPNGCVPGGGCGVVAAGFDVIGTGTAEIVATRTSCGEAMGCTGDRGSYRLTVIASA